MDTILLGFISGNIGTKNAWKTHSFAFWVSRLHKISSDGKIYTKTDLNIWTSIRQNKHTCISCHSPFEHQPDKTSMHKLSFTTLQSRRSKFARHAKW